MTPEERSLMLVRRLKDTDVPETHHPLIESLIHRGIVDAIAEEREACAKLVENAAPSIQEIRDSHDRLICYADIPTWGDVAIAIRARP